MSRRVVVLAVAGFLTVLLAAVAALLPVPYVALRPGPTSNTLGSIGGKQLIQVSGHPTYPDKGHLDLVTVSVLGGPAQRLDLVSAFRGWLDSSVAVVPEETVYPKGQSAQQAEQEGATEMSQSQQAATTAALHQLGIPVTSTVVVASLAPKSPSQGKLRAGDQIVSVNGTAVPDEVALRNAITAVAPGTDVRLVVQRDGKSLQTTVTTAKGPTGTAVIGVVPQDVAHYPFKISFGLRDVGGPSAGMMFALGIIDKLTPGSLTGGRYIAGTGTIDENGKVGAIGGITQKMIGAKHNGATVFFSPAANCATAAATKPAGLRLVKVRTLADAVNALDDLRAGRSASLPSC